MPDSRPPILVNDNLHSHEQQRGVLRVLDNTVAALAASFGPSVLVCSPRRRAAPGVRRRHIPRPPGRAGELLSNVLPIQSALVSAVAAWERPGAIYQPYYGRLLSAAPQVYTVYDLIVERSPEHFPREKYGVRALIGRKRRCLETAALLLAISAATAGDIRALYPHVDPGKIVVIPLGVEEVFFSAPAPLAAPRPYLLFAGNRSHYKNFPALVEAFARAGLAGRYDLRVFSPGAPGFTAEEQALLRRHGLAGRVLLSASPGDEQVRDLYAGAAALVYPSLIEGFGLPVLEAMACGALVVASNTASIPEVGGDVPLYFDPRSVDDLAAALARADRMPADERRERVGRGRARAREYTWEQFRARTAAAFRRLLAPAH